MKLVIVSVTVVLVAITLIIRVWYIPWLKKHTEEMAMAILLFLVKKHAENDRPRRYIIHNAFVPEKRKIWYTWLVNRAIDSLEENGLINQEADNEHGSLVRNRELLDFILVTLKGIRYYRRVA